MEVGEIRGIKLKLSIFLPGLFLIYFLLGIGEKALMVFTVILIHELGHVFCALYLGMRVRTIELFPLGGVARMENVHPGCLGKEIALYLAGPAVNLLLGGIWGLALYFNLSRPEIWSFLLRATLVLGAFNLLPVWPLDGGRIFRAVLSRFTGFLYAARFVTLFSQVWAVGFFIYGTWAVVNNPVDFHWWIIAGFLFFLNRQERSMVYLNYLRYLTQKEREMEQAGFLPAVLFVAESGVTLRKVIERLVPHRYYLIYVVDPKGNLLGLITEKKLIQLALKGSMNITLEEVFEKKDQ